MFIFPKKCDGAEELKYVFPSKQRAAQKAIEIAKQDKRIKRLIVFGSAVTMNCGMTSDIDIAIDAPDVSSDDFANVAHQFFTDIPSEVDIIHYNKVRNAMLAENIDKGVCIYAQH